MLDKTSKTINAKSLKAGILGMASLKLLLSSVMFRSFCSDDDFRSIHSWFRVNYIK